MFPLPVLNPLQPYDLMPERAVQPGLAQSLLVGKAVVLEFQACTILENPDIADFFCAEKNEPLRRICFAPC